MGTRNSSSSSATRHLADVISRVDAKLGDGLEAVLRHHHARRLERHGWYDVTTAAPSWRSDRVPVREGNAVRVLIDGHEAMPAIAEAIRGAQESVHIAGWHSSPDFRMSPGPDGPILRDLLAEAAERVPVRLLMWGGPPVPAFQPTRRTVKQARDEFERDSKAQVALDTRERTMHCHHEKLVIVDGRAAFVGGIDMTALAGDRLDGAHHPAEDQLGWHDCGTAVEGPAVHDVALHFIARWDEVTGESLPEPPPCPPAGDVDLQVVRTVPDHTYDFLPDGEYTILETYLRALRAAERFIYLENQFLWSPEVAEVLVDKLRNPPTPDFRVLLVLPSKPNNGKDTTRGQLAVLLDADDGNGRLLATTLIGSRKDGPGVYVHAKVGIVDDRWLTIGSANLNEHSLFNDTEMNVVTTHAELVRDTRLRLWGEHTERSRDELDGPVHEVVDRIWRPMAEEQDAISERGGAPVHNFRSLAGVSRRTDRLQGPLRGLLVDG